MAEEPQPPTIHEGADPEDDPPVAPKSAEDRKTAAALSSLDKRGDDDDDDEDGAAGAKSQLDREALGKAMSRLEVGGKKGAESAGKGAGAKEAEGEVVRKRVVKVDQADVALLVEELELSKGKATDLLKAHEGDAVRALRAFVTASA